MAKFRIKRADVKLNFGTKIYDENNYKDIPFDKGIYAAFSLPPTGSHKPTREKLLYIGMGDYTPVKQRIYDHIHST